jgi:sigma-E factor negative regulatory protein RseA
MDGEAGRFEAAAAVNELVRSPELAGCWERWHLIGRALRREPNALLARDTAARVRVAVARADAVSFDNPVPVHRLRWLAAPVGGALAAGIAVLGLAFLLTQPTSQQVPENDGLTAAAERWQQPDPAVRSRLDRLLVNHHEQVAGAGRAGVGTYAAVIGYERLP